MPLTEAYEKALEVKAHGDSEGAKIERLNDATHYGRRGLSRIGLGPRPLASERGYHLTGFGSQHHRVVAVQHHPAPLHSVISTD